MVYLHKTNSFAVEKRKVSTYMFSLLVERYIERLFYIFHLISLIKRNDTAQFNISFELDLMCLIYLICLAYIVVLVSERCASFVNTNHTFRFYVSLVCVRSVLLLTTLLCITISTLSYTIGQYLPFLRCCTADTFIRFPIFSSNISIFPSNCSPALRNYRLLLPSMLWFNCISLGNDIVTDVFLHNWPHSMDDLQTFQRYHQRIFVGIFVKMSQ